MTPPVRVLHVVNGFGVGGVSSVVGDWISGMEGSRFRSEVLVLSDKLEFLESGSLPEGVSVASVPIEPPPDHSVVGYLKDGFLSRRARERGRAAIRHIEERRPGILHLHTVAQDIGIGIAAARKTGATLVFTDHLLRIRMDEYSPLVRGLLRVALRRLYRRCHLISVGRPVAEANLSSGFVGRSRLHLELPNRVDTHIFRPRGAEAPDAEAPQADAPHAEAPDAAAPDAAAPDAGGSRAPAPPLEIVYVARIHRSKGQDTLVRAFRAMRTRVPVRLTLVGPDETGGALDAVLRETAGAGEGGPERPVRILGSRFDVPEILRAGDIGAFPSLREGRPLALLEMMATGLPVVVNHIPELVDMVRHEVDGLIVPSGNVEALARALDRLADDPALRARLGGAARERVVREAGGSNAATVARFYEEALAL